MSTIGVCGRQAPQQIATTGASASWLNSGRPRCCATAGEVDFGCACPSNPARRKMTWVLSSGQLLGHRVEFGLTSPGRKAGVIDKGDQFPTRRPRPGAGRQARLCRLDCRVARRGSVGSRLGRVTSGPRHICPTAVEAVACRSRVWPVGVVPEARTACAASNGAKAAAAWAKASTFGSIALGAAAVGSISVPPWPSLSTG